MIKFGMKLPEIFNQLVRGYKKFTGRNPEGLDLIKIRQESMRRFEDMNKVVDMQGRSIDTSKGIMGGVQVGQKGIFDNIFNKMQRDMGKGKPKEVKKKKDDPEEKADGGRIGFKKGMDRRTFMKIMGGLTTLPILGKFFKGAEVAAPVAEKAVQAAKSIPPYFFRLVEKIRFMGEETLASQDKAIAKKYKDYVMEEDFAGNIEIIKRGEDLQGNKLEDVYMSYKVDEVPVTGGKKGSAKVEEYEEFTARPDAEGKMKDVEPGVPDEVVEEAGDVDSMTLKRAGGGIARMLGE